MGSRASKLLIPLILFALVLSFSGIGYSYILSSPLGQFNVSDFDNSGVNTTYLNWTNNYNNWMNVSTNSTFNGSLIVRIWSETSGLLENYTQANTQTACLNGSLILLVKNSTGFSNITVVNGTFNLTFNTASCMPGRYYTNNFTVANLTRQNESANITVILDLPINNTDQVTGMGTFRGQIPLNYSTYQSYYFNTSLVPNATSVTINMTGWTLLKDVDIFLFNDSAAFKTRSTNKSSATETLRYQYLPNDTFWEIRVFGNSTSAVSYTGNILYSTLNITHPDDSNSQISLLDFSVKNASQTNNTNITIRNSGNISASSVAETKELYLVKRFVGNGTSNFTFIMPDSSMFTRIKVILNWTGNSNYSFNLYDLNQSLVATALNQHVQGNTSGVASHIYNETSSVSGTTGSWIVEVKNNTNVLTNPYNLTVLMYVNPSTWVATNYSTFSFNTSGTTNSTIGVSINLTIPNVSVDGIYEGQLLYLDRNNAGITLPLLLNVTAPVFSLNSSMNTLTYRIDENTGVNLTRNFTFILNNTGSYPMVLNFGKLSGTLNFSFNSSNNTQIPANGHAAMNVTVGFLSDNTTGTYDGAIYINATNETVSLSSHPYQTLNLTLRLNLTTLLTVNVSQLLSITNNNVVTNVTLGDNVTIKFRLYHINNTEITDSLYSFNTSNVSIWLVETNTSKRIPTSGYLTTLNGTNPMYSGGFYNVNATISVNQTGGQYDVHVIANYTKGSTSFSGEGINRSLIINNTGLFMSANASGTGCSFGSSCNANKIQVANNTATTVFYINVTNYGPMTASSLSINITENCAGFGVAQGTVSGCPSTTFAPTGYSSSCIVPLTITTLNSNYSDCTFYLRGDPEISWFNRYGLNFTIEVTLPSGSVNSTSSSSSSNPSTTAPTPNSSLSFSIAEKMIYIEQGKTNTTTVQIKNTGSTTQVVTFSIDTINKSWYSVNSTTSTTLSTGKVAGYLVTFNPGNADFKDYSGNFKANGSSSSATSALTLRVLPPPEKRTEITTTFAQLNANLTSIIIEVNNTKNSGKNVSEAELKLDMLKAKINQANTFLGNGDYYSAYQLISEIQSLYSQTKDALSKSTALATGFDVSKILGGQAGYLTYVLIGGVVAAAAFLAYLFWPTKVPVRAAYGSPTKTVIGPSAPKRPLSERFQFLGKIKEFFSKIFNRGPKQTYQGT